MRAAHEAPRCEHVRINGQRCAAPALRGQTHCHFHEHIQPQALYNEIREPFLPFVEDATSLQCALMRVMRLLTIEEINYKRCALLLYALQIACSNLKNFMAEHPQPEIDEGERPQPKVVTADEPKKVNAKNGNEGTLAELLEGLLAKGKNGGSTTAPLRIRSRALPGESTAARQ
jgi:hypothetical protein